MLQLDIIAEATLATGVNDGAIGYCIDRRAVTAAEIQAAVHALVAQDGMAPHAVAGSDPAVGWASEFAVRLTDARCFKPVGPAAALPFQHLRGRLAVALETRIDQVTDFDLAGFRAAIGQDDVKLVGAANVPGDRHFGANDLQIFLHGFGRCAGSASGSVQARADCALDSQRRVIDQDRLALELQLVAVAQYFQIQVETRAKRQLVKRPCLIFRRATTQYNVNLCAGLDIAKRNCPAHQIVDLYSLITGDPGALQHPAQTVAATKRRNQLDRGAFGAFRQWPHGVGCRHPDAGVGPVSKRCNHLRASLIGPISAQRIGPMSGNRTKVGKAGYCKAAQGGQCHQPAEPCRAADIHAEVGDPVKFGSIITPFGEFFVERRGFG